MKNFRLKPLLLGSMLSIAACLCSAGGIEDLNCGINSLFGGNCSEIQKINAYQEQQQAAWMSGSITATQMVNSVINFHKNLTQIDGYNKELYMYNLQVAQVCDAGKITKEAGLYLMTKKENELGERIQANQPPPNRPLNCVSRSFGGQTTTTCQ